MEEVINFDSLEKYIKEIEDIFKKNELSIIGQRVVMQEAFNRIQKNIDKTKVQDMLNDLPLMDTVKGLLKRGGDDGKD